MKDVSDELVTVNDLTGVVCLITHDSEVGDTSSTLNFTEEGGNGRDELGSGELIVELEEEELGGSSNCFQAR